MQKSKVLTKLTESFEFCSYCRRYIGKSSGSCPSARANLVRKKAKGWESKSVLCKMSCTYMICVTYRSEYDTLRSDDWLADASSIAPSICLCAGGVNSIRSSDEFVGTLLSTSTLVSRTSVCIMILHLRAWSCDADLANLVRGLCYRYDLHKIYFIEA